MDKLSRAYGTTRMIIVRLEMGWRTAPAERKSTNIESRVCVLSYEKERQDEWGSQHISLSVYSRVF